MWSLLPPIFLCPTGTLQYDGWCVDAQLHPYATLLTAWNDWLESNLQSLLDLLASATDELVERHYLNHDQTSSAITHAAIINAVNSMRSC